MKKTFTLISLISIILLNGCTQTQTGSRDFEVTINFIDENITQIVESADFAPAPANGKWYADGFGFTSPNNVYVDFEDGHFLFRVLLNCTGSTPNLTCEAMAFFETDHGWILMSGQDSEKDNPIVYKWAKDYDWTR